MTKKWLEENLMEFYQSSSEKYIPRSSPFPLTYAGELMCEAPILGYGSASDPMFETLKEPHVVGARHHSPQWWLPEAKSVISIFMPFSEAVRRANARHEGGAAPEWLHGRIEGHHFLMLMAQHVVQELKKQGYKAVVPDGRGIAEIADPRFQVTNVFSPEGIADPSKYGSNWSERHVAYVCGMGTFSLSRALITKKGCAGRFCNIVTDLELEPSPREYDRFDQHCTRCGACVRKCPAGAISLETGKNHVLCNEFLDKSKTEGGYYGCGKCQTGVPCEHAIP